MNKTDHTEFYRYFMLRTVPTSLSPADRHVQILDNYIFNTRLRLRTLRVPGDSRRERYLQQRIWASLNSNTELMTTEIELAEEEYAQFSTFEGREIRKNRYRSEVMGDAFDLDIYLGQLKGLVRAAFSFPSHDAARSFTPPSSEYLDISEYPQFRDEVLVDTTSEEVFSAVE